MNVMIPITRTQCKYTGKSRGANNASGGLKEMGGQFIDMMTAPSQTIEIIDIDLNEVVAPWRWTSPLTIPSHISMDKCTKGIGPHDLASTVE